MLLKCLILSLLPFCMSYYYETHYFEQLVDHFSYAIHDTFQQRYLVSDTFWNRTGGPIFFYTGNEGDIFMFAKNTGIMWEFAEEFQALIVFAEHRYYGESLPYGPESFKDLLHLGYLSSEQALADFAKLIEYLKIDSGDKNRSVVAFGGSYGGMLAAWLRIKYPHLVVGSLASSAPIFQFTDLTPCNVFDQIVTQDFIKPSVNCAKSIRLSWDIIRKMGQTDAGLEWLTHNFHLCHYLTSETVGDLVSWLGETWTNLAMTNYPYPTDFLMPLPANPIEVACQYLQNLNKSKEQLLQDIMRAASVFQNYTGSVPCFNLSYAGGTSLGEDGWDFQACTEMVMPLCSDGVHDMFEPREWDLNKTTENCERRWHVRPEPFQVELVYGGKNITAASNIIFSNGLLDPWSGGGVLKSLSPSLTAIVMPEAAHHLDLRASNPNDPVSVTNARYMEKKIIAQWLE